MMFFLKLPGVKGASKMKGHAGEFELNSFAHQTGPAHQWENVVVSKNVDESTPRLQMAIADGRVFPNAFIIFVDEGREVLRVVMKAALITNYSLYSYTETLTLESDMKILVVGKK